MLSFWYKEFPQYPRDHADYWRVRLVFHTFLLASVAFALLALINAVLYHDMPLVVLDASGCVLSLALYGLFRRYGNIAVTAMVMSVVVTTIMLLFIVGTQGHSYSIIWATIIPPFTFFLSGKRWGTFLSTIIFVVCVYFVYQQVITGDVLTIGTGAMLNVLEASIVHILLFRFYECTRTVAFERVLEQKQQLLHVAETDSLTALYNRTKFDAECRKRLACPTTNIFSLVIFDIDNFKRINDSYGHSFGDEVLKGVAQRIQENLRDNDILARWGGEEFVALLTDTDTAGAHQLTQRVLRAFRAEPILQVPVTFSAGMTHVEPGEPADRAFQRADSALYQAKAEGKNRVVERLP